MLVGEWQQKKKSPLVVHNGNSLKMSSNLVNRLDSGWKKVGNRQLSQVLRSFIFFFVTIVWSEVKCISFPDYIRGMNLCRIMTFDSVIISVLMSARKSNLGKRKNIPRPIPIQSQISAVHDRLGTGKDQRQEFVIFFVM